MSPQRLLLRAQDLKSVMQRYLLRLRQHRDALNRLNVYPVPDGDTGTNMTLTVQSVVDAVDGAESMEQLAGAIAEGSLMGAQGNSGIILSQILRGLADAFRPETSIGVAHLVDALERASDAAYRAVGEPVEGTILTVLKAAAVAAGESGSPVGEDLADLMLRVFERAQRALEETPELLPVLKEAGVVDAGGAGFLLLLAAFLEEVTGEEVTLPAAIFSGAPALLLGHGSGEEISMDGPRYEVMYLLRSESVDAGDRLRDSWAEVGESIVVVGGGGVWNCHIHTDEIGTAIEVGISVGTPESIKITDLFQQVAAERAPEGYAALAQFAEAEVGVVAVASGPGVVSLFRDAGAQYVVVGGQTKNPSVRDLLAAVEAVAAETVIVLPNNKNIVPVAEQLDALTEKSVRVVPTRSVPEGLAAMFAYMPDADAGTSLINMQIAASACGWGEVTRAVRDSRTPAGDIAEGQWLGVVGGEVSVIAEEEAAAAIGVLTSLLTEDSEVVTVISGEDATEAATAAVIKHLGDSHPELEVTVVPGGQAVYPYLIGVE